MNNFKAILTRTSCSIAFIAAFCNIAAFSQTVDITADSTTTTGSVFGTNLYAVNESIYTETEIGAANFTTAAFPINQVSFNVNQVGSNPTFTNITVWLKEVPLETTTFTSGTYTSAGYTQVFAGSVFANITGWIPIPLEVPFQRTSGNNLQLLIERSDGVGHTGYIYESASGNNTGNTAASSRRYNGTTALSGTTSLSASAFRAQIRLQYVDPVPVTLMSFEVKRLGKINQVDWRTSLELNTKMFLIERSTDGRNFSSIGKVTASGNSTVVHSYSFSDNAPVRGINYYRLRILDIDNSSKYSPVRKVRNEGSADIAIYPNPVKTLLNVKINADKADKAQLVISDISGKKMISEMVVIQKGINVIPVAIKKLTAGNYVMKITLSDDVIISQFVLQQ